jgi:choline dehydrogenase
VILAGGTFNTPQLLMLSGIGPKDHLDKFGIPCRVNLQGVGSNLQDRYEVGVVSELKRDLAVLGSCSFSGQDDPADACLQEWKQAGGGVYATNGAVLAIIRRSDPKLPDPDLFIFGLPGRFEGYFPHYAENIVAKRNVFTWAILKAHTGNTAGTVRLRSNKPREVPDINFKYFDEGSPEGAGDLDAVVEGVKFARDIMQEPGLAGLVTRTVLLSGHDISDDAKLADLVKRLAWGHHACGTCRMGKPGAKDTVVDSEFRVQGVKNLRVVDASVFPKIPGFFIVTSVYMVSEKAADVIHAAHQP